MVNHHDKPVRVRDGFSPGRVLGMLVLLGVFAVLLFMLWATYR